MTRIVLKTHILIIFVILAQACCSLQENRLERMIDKAFSNAIEQYGALADSLLREAPGMLPHSLQEDGQITLVKPAGWTSGFFPGSLWYIYEYSGDERFRELAEKYTAYLSDQQFNRGTHDVGFMMYCSYGNGMRISPDSTKRSILIASAESLVSRFNPAVGCIKSWDREVKPGWRYPVIIDNMMNLELLLWATEETGDSKFEEVAKTHSNTTIRNHFRLDNSSYHLVNYDGETGDVLFRGTVQGLSDDSAWARGQGWGLYGFTMLYRFTKDEAYLNKAKDIAGYIMSRPTMPRDRIPYWDFMADDETSPRDASAASVYASALLELSGYVDKTNRNRYIQYAIDILRSLSGPRYTAAPGTNGRFLLRHSVTSFPKGSEVDRPLNYADYYYLEALMRLRAVINNR